MAETFVITVLSFGLVLAVVAALLVWVILPALNEEEEKTKDLTLADYIDQINTHNTAAYHYDSEQQEAIEDNADEIENIKDDLEELAAAGGTGVSTATEASATLEDGIWTISQGQFTFKATPTHLCDADGDDCQLIEMTAELPDEA